MNNQEQARRIWADLPRENPRDRKRSRELYDTELVVLGGDPAPDTRAGTWISRVHELERFSRLNGRLPKRGSPSAAEASLGEWIHHQAQRQSTMCAYGYLRIEAVPRWNWAHRKAAWLARYNALDQFIHANGRPPSRAADDAAERSIAKWAQRQRDAARAGKLTDIQRRDLRVLGFPMPPAKT